MTRTKATTLLLLAIAAGALAWAVEVWLHAQGRAMLIPAATLPITLVVIAAILLAFGWPIRRYTRWLRRERDRRAQAALAAGIAPAELDDAELEADLGREGARAAGRSSDADDPAPKRPDPFIAMRVLALAKASAFSGAIIGGGTLAILGFALTRSFVEAGAAWLAGASALSALVLLATGLLVESWCSLPPDDRRTAPRGIAALD
ncbi:hypothetical protein USB125703_00534 [Pseudoclavibacter triregionum]|nr:hypothetical protein USB125703_00534 [Pseudoclavibacter triregionum]